MPSDARGHARSALRYAIKMGRVKRGPCEVCGTKRVWAYWPDYGEPAGVMWLCTQHRREERERSEAEARAERYRLFLKRRRRLDTRRDPSDPVWAQ
jgi:hypothetical protein